ncbi:ATP-grasp domain-containing protein [Acaryochloris sp. 'Moss Beach']|uniref:ATP-grasp domain-containing protein n=1 Tax=Acaryochloris sp. 'Moss Beach' TaxID=2740837 RepID=UPI0028F459FA|nr:ATP-grasp domain-containing protein [Acaryochloris sp. 'Moss Beach']
MQDEMSFIYKGILERICPEHPDIENINVSRDKYKMRCVLRARNISQPYFALVNSESALLRIIESCPFPCVSKPLSGSGSYLIRKNDSPIELQESYLELKEIFEQGQHAPFLEQPFLLVEQYLPGKDFHVEGIIDNGQIRILACHEKLSAFISDNSFSPAISISPPISLDRANTNKIEESVIQTISILKIDNTVFNVDLRFDGNQTTIIEVNPRLGGATIRQTILELTGLDAVELHVQLALGEHVNWPVSNSSKTNCLYRIPITKSGLVSNIGGIDISKKDLDVCGFVLNYQVGDYIKFDKKKADNHFGYAHVVSDTPQHALQAMKNLITNLKIEISGN